MGRLVVRIALVSMSLASGLVWSLASLWSHVDTPVARAVDDRNSREAELLEERGADVNKGAGQG